jgi:hypothetical protein
MLKFEKSDKVNEIKVEPVDKAVGIGTREEIEEYLRNRYVDTYYDLDSPMMVDIEIKEKAFNYFDKDACRVTINDTEYSLPFIYKIIEHIRGKKMITQDDKPYKRAIGQKYVLDMVIPDKSKMPILMTHNDTDNWYILAPIFDSEV